VRTADVLVLVALSVLTRALVATYIVAGSSGVSAPRAGIDGCSPSAARSATSSSSACTASLAPQARSRRRSPRSAPRQARSRPGPW
jgi:hypothetical protein